MAERRDLALGSGVLLGLVTGTLASLFAKALYGVPAPTPSGTSKPFRKVRCALPIPSPLHGWLCGGCCQPGYVLASQPPRVPPLPCSHGPPLWLCFLPWPWWRLSHHSSAG